MPTPDETIIIQLEADIEMRKCIEYLTLLEQGETKTAIADHFGIARSTLYEWIVLWDRGGVLERARSVVLVPRAEEIAAAVDKVIRAWPDVIERQLKIALSSPNEANARASADWLNTQVVKPTMEERERPGAEEMQYLTLYENRPASPLLVARSEKKEEAS